MNKWIRVQERMPSNSASVLVWCPEHKNIYTAYWVALYWYHFAGEFNKKVQEAVTHWMPIPTAPPPPLTKEQQITETIIDTVQKIGHFPEWGEDIRPFARTLTGEIMFNLERYFN